MDWWQTLVGTALLGTDRQSPTIPTEDTPLATSIQHLPWDNPAQALLATMGTVALHSQVGYCPPTKDWSAFSPCPGEDIPCCSVVIGRYIQRCQGEYADVLPELLTLVAQQGQRIPETLLPGLLDLGVRNTTLRPSITAVLGRSGQWLAAQNQVWDYGSGVTISPSDLQSEAFQQIWKEGSRGERLALLSLWREEDAEGARDALVQVWPGELAKDREALLAVLEPQLSMTDEPFLEQTLDDRAKGVRQGAIALLLQLPESRLCQRMAERIHPYLQLHSSDQKPMTIEVVLPDAYDAQWRRDGIVELHPNHRSKKQGKRAGWFWQLLASTPLNTWLPLSEDPSISDATAIDSIMKATNGHQWQDILLKGWAIATQRQHSTLWAKALLQHFNVQSFNGIDPQLYPSLLTLLAVDQQEMILMSQKPDSMGDAFFLWLQQVAHPTSSHVSQSWSLPFSRFVWQQMATFIQAKKITRARAYQWFSVIKDVGLTLHPAIAPDIATAIETLTSRSSYNPWEQPLADFYSRLNFRYAIHQVLAQD